MMLAYLLLYSLLTTHYLLACLQVVLTLLSDEGEPMPQPARPHAPQPKGVAQLERVWPRRLAVRRESEEGAIERAGLIGDAHTWMARRGGIGHLGGGSLEQLRGRC